MDASTTDLTRLKAAPATCLSRSHGFVTIARDDELVVIRMHSAVQWHRQSDGSLVEPGAFCLPAAIYARFVDDIATHMEGLSADHWPASHSLVGDTRSDELTNAYHSLFSSLALDREGNYIRPSSWANNGTDAKPLLVRRQITLPLNAERLRFRSTDGTWDHHRIQFRRESEEPVNGLWTYTAQGPIEVVHYSWPAYLFHNFKRDSTTGAMRLFLRLSEVPSIDRPFSGRPHSRRPSARLVQQAVSALQRVLSNQSNEIMNQLLYECEEGIAEADYAGPPALREALTRAQRQVMRGACSRPCIGSLRADHTWVEVIHPVVNCGFTEATVDGPAQLLKRRMVETMQDTAESSPADALRLTVNAEILEQQSSALFRDFGSSEVSREGSAWQRARLLRQMMQHTVTLADTTTVQLMEAAQGIPRPTRADLPLCYTSAFVEPLDGTERGAAIPVGEIPSTAIGASLTMDVFFDYRDGAGVREAQHSAEYGAKDFWID